MSATAYTIHISPFSVQHDLEVALYNQTRAKLLEELIAKERAEKAARKREKAVQKQTKKGLLGKIFRTNQLGRDEQVQPILHAKEVELSDDDISLADALKR